MYHWIMTGLWSDPRRGGVTQSTLNGTVEPVAGETRQDLYNRLLDTFAEAKQIPSTMDLAVVFFSLEANELPGARRFSPRLMRK